MITRFTFEIKLNHSANTHGKERLLEYLEYVLKIDQGSDKGGGVVQRLFGRYKTQCIRCATTKFSAWYLFCSYKIQNNLF